MKVGEYRTNGKAVAYRRDIDTLELWQDAESMSTTRPITDTHAEILTHGWRTMTPGEVSLWCAPPSPAEAVSADIARVRADKAEAALAQARKVAAAMDIYYHRQGCPYGMCNCGADVGNKARRELLAILEVKS